MQNGQPNAQFLKEQRNAKEYYDLGRQVAKVEQDKKETEQVLAMTMLQKAQVQEAAMQTNLLVQQLQGMVAQIQGGGGIMGGGAPPPPPEGDPSMMPPPEGDPSMMPPPEQGGMPPEAAMGGGGGMPPMM